MCASCAFASDPNQTCNLADAGDFEMNLDVEEGYSSADASGNVVLEISQTDLENDVNMTGNVVEEEFSPEIIPATYNDLCHDIENLKPGDVYDIKKDYIIEDCDKDLSKNRIININADNVVINGNGHTIDGNKNRGYFAIFNVTGNNVTIMNLNIVKVRACNLEYQGSYWNHYGADYTRVVSPIEWHGDNGVLSNCTFDDNNGEDGGALYWIANNGLIDNCYFNLNAATRGGSIFISGYNNTIRNSIFKDSFSFYLDGIFFKNFDEKGEVMEFALYNCSFEDYRGYMNDFHVEGPCRITSDNKVVYPIVPPESYNELRNIITTLKEGDVYNLTRDYYFDYNCCYYQIMPNNVTINGNGHKIYGSVPAGFPLIWVKGNNVKVFNLTFDFNDLDNYGASFVYWIGNNGTLANCTFIGNQVTCGGAITWKGNDGIIDNCAFINNTAKVAAGAIFISGENNKVSNSLFINCYSKWNDEAIYVDHKRKDLTFENIAFYNLKLNLFDEGSVNCDIDMEDISPVNYIYVGGECIELSELIYHSIIDGGLIQYNDKILYYSAYYNDTGDFIFTIIRDYAEYDISYLQNYYFNNISNYSYNAIFNKLKDNDYESKFTITKKAYVSNGSDYLNLLKNFYKGKTLIPIYDVLKEDAALTKTMAKKDSFTLALDMIFTKSLTINCPNAWNLTLSSFDVLNIEGAGSKIRGPFDSSDDEKFIIMSEKNVFAAQNITFEGFNTVIENMGGQCILDHVNFNKNKMDYFFERDWGAAILNTGVITCINCSFTNNYAKNGGAIFNQGLLTVQNCLFANNEAYGEGNHICVGDGGKVIYNGKLITSDSQCAFVHITQSMSLAAGTLLTVTCVVASFVTGTLVGVLTANPITGGIAGCAVGALLGSACAGWIISEHFDVNYDRTKTILTLVLGSAGAGALGGIAGGFVGAQWAAEAQWIAENGGPENAWVEISTSGLDPYVTGEVLGAGLSGAIVGIVFYFTN
ncbi:hypothetical protein [Methanobrevibacter sp. YE315]|uniref:hypothetical protein n=1 Tax=Methanobrevibacter sp. YE315 TaxID=1609968 RepID=UPI0012DCE50F|nr:hypothetical protein [Methanobrevibacter sp. YE315]